jgi:hypothetical protein
MKIGIRLTVPNCDYGASPHMLRYHWALFFDLPLPQPLDLTT